MTPDNRQENARNEIAAANDALRVAQAALSLHILRDAMSRTYYAVFHAARALTLLEGFEAKPTVACFTYLMPIWFALGKSPRNST